jgi:transcriptional regulator with XRE-family HTH domain
MTANPPPAVALTLGGFLRDRRARVNPGPEARTRRRTPGLRREEVATRAGVSLTWYTWLEQGRGGPPSDDVVERLARALELDVIGREVLFLLAQKRPPPLVAAPLPQVTPALQRVLDAMPTSPAMVKTVAWDIVAWNEAAEAVLGDYRQASPNERNMLRRLFGDPTLPDRLPEWEHDARYALAVFRVDIARAGDNPAAIALAAELHATSPHFRRLWAENDVRAHWVGRKRLQHHLAGPLELETSAFAVEGSDGLTMVVFVPATPADVRAIEGLLAARDKAA